MYIPSWVKYGKNITIHENCTVGTEGFGAARDVNGEWVHIPHIGGVVIGDNVEICAGTNVDRGTVNDTVIESGTKIDHHCHIAHNCKIGKNCAIAAGVTFSGSVIVGDNVWIGPGSTIINGIKIGDNAYIGIGTNVIEDVPDNAVVVGNPGRVLRIGGQPHLVIK